MEAEWCNQEEYFFFQFISLFEDWVFSYFFFFPKCLIDDLKLLSLFKQLYQYQFISFSTIFINLSIKFLCNLEIA
jgi:hypothetical protein